MRLAFPEPLCIFLRNSRSTSVHDSAIEFEVQVKVVYSRECLLNNIEQWERDRPRASAGTLPA